jgi:hypothetical protein
MRISKGGIMLRQRDRFERSDVPKPGAFRNTIAAAVLALCAVACLLLWNVCWRKANQMNNLNNGELYDALYDQLSPTEPSAGRVWSDATFSNVQIFIVDDVNAEHPQLLGEQIFVRNTDTNECTIVDLPVNMKVWLSEGVSSLPVQFEEGGAVQALPPLTNATNVHVSHVIVATDRIWDQLARFKGPTIRALFSRQTNDFGTIASDFSTGELIKFGEMLQEIGFENINHMDAPYWDDVLADGTEVSVVDWQELPTQLGIFEWPPTEE